jgi:hypothetical protein
MLLKLGEKMFLMRKYFGVSVKRWEKRDVLQMGEVGKIKP